MPEKTTVNPSIDARLAELERSKRAEGKTDLVKTRRGDYFLTEIDADDLDKIFGADDPQQEYI